VHSTITYNALNLTCGGIALLGWIKEAKKVHAIFGYSFEPRKNMKASFTCCFPQTVGGLNAVMIRYSNNFYT
jgi:hypothetical protein